MEVTSAPHSLTMQSMLASCKKKERPPDDDRYVRTAPKSPKKVRQVPVSCAPC
jgi:ubiquitin-conjugating enzyme E2 W